MYMYMPQVLNSKTRLKCCSLLCTPNTCKCILNNRLGSQPLRGNSYQREKPEYLYLLKEAAKNSN